MNFISLSVILIICLLCIVNSSGTLRGPALKLDLQLDLQLSFSCIGLENHAFSESLLPSVPMKPTF